MFCRCPLPTHDLRNGKLNQKAYSFYFFIRDVCNGDIITFFDNIIRSNVPNKSNKGKDELISHFSRIYGVKDKLANMTLSDLFLSDNSRKDWLQIGQKMIAIDSLVHNFLYRTGILRYYRHEHIYGDSCSKKCGEALSIISKKIDAREYDKNYPKLFPRFIQHSIWRFCAKDGENICNGNNINDTTSCMRDDICKLYNLCDKVALK
jgi:hypothetical protein